MRKDWGLHFENPKSLAGRTYENVRPKLLIAILIPVFESHGACTFPYGAALHRLQIDYHFQKEMKQN